MKAGTFAIVADVAHVDRAPLSWRRVGRLPVMLVGNLLTIAGILCMALFAVAIGLALFAFRVERDLGPFDEGVLVLAVVVLAVAQALVPNIGVRLVRGQRRSVLFLRRFGFTAATEVLSEAINRGLGQRWRLITLDDLQVLPVGTEPRRRRFGFALGVLPFFALVAAAFWLGPPWLEREHGDTIDKVVAEIEASGVASLADEKVQSIAIGAFLIGMAVTSVIAGGAFTIGRFGVRLATRRTEGRRVVQIDRSGDVERVVRRVERRTNRIDAHRLTVVRCANELWQTVVRRFADCTDVVLIDVSQPSAGLLWELTELGSEHATEWILVGHLHRLVELETDRSPDAVRLRELLAGQTVLSYDPENSARFQHALKARLEHVE